MKTKRMKKLLMGMGLSRNQVNHMVKTQRMNGSPRVSNVTYYSVLARDIQILGRDWLPCLTSLVLE